MKEENSIYLTINEWGWVSYEELRRSRGVSAEADDTLRDLHNSSYNAKAEFNNCFIIYSKIIPSLFTIYMRKPEIVIGESKFVPFRRSKRTENVGCRLSQSNFSTLLSLSSLFRYTLKVKFNCWMFTKETFNRMISVNGKHPVIQV